MAGRPNRWRSVIFGSALALPCLAAIALGVRLISQDQRLAADSVVQEQRRAIEQLGGALMARLERIKLEEASSLAAASDPIAAPRHAEVMALGWIRGGRLVLPWDPGFTAHRVTPPSSKDATFAAALARGERAEFVDKNPDAAIAEYETARAIAPSASQADDADLRRARAIVKKNCTCTDDARRLYQHLLTVSTVDDQGVPLALYAGGQLIESKTDPAPVLDMLQDRLLVDRWLAPSARYGQRDLLDAIAPAALNEAERGRAQMLRAALQPAITHLDDMLALQRDFPRLMPAAGSPGADREASWIPYAAGPHTWLLSEAPSLGGAEPFAIAVSADPVFAVVTGGDAFPAPRLSFARAGGELVGQGFPDLRVSFGAVRDAAPLQNWARRRGFYASALAAILAVAITGGYLVWRDVRRELRVADLRSQFVAGVSHELKTPLTAIRMLAETLQMDRVSSPPTRAQYLDTIVHESERLTRLIDNVLDFSRIDRGDKAYRFELSPLPLIVRDAATAMEYPLARQGFQLHVDVADDLPLVAVDSDGIRQAVLNLLSNAIKYSSDRRDVDLSLSRVNGDAVIAVTDRGIGIPASELPRIFRRFYRANVPDNQRIPGTGLGLALVNHIVKAHGGRVDVRSTPGQGSTFAIHLPIDPGHTGTRSPA